MQTLNRVQPAGPVEAYRTYQIAVPRTHLRPATCEEYGCLSFRHGFSVTVLDGDERRHFLIKTSGRPYRAEPQRGQTLYVFAAGTRCFREPSHTVQVAPEIYLVRGGDWRRNLGLVRRHVDPDHWVEDFAEHTDKIATEARKG